MSSDDQTAAPGASDPRSAAGTPADRTAPLVESTVPLPSQVEAEPTVAELEHGRYQLVERVGAGSVGQVWRARDLTLQREVAIKTVNLATSADPSTEARFRREAVATAGLDHPNIVQIYDSGVDGHTAFLVMEFLRGPNLQSLVNREGPIPFKAAVPLLAQVAAGLRAAHAIGVTHRDVKPANVVLDSDSLQAIPKLVDFGIARLNDQGATALTSTMTAIGSAAYMSPEQASGERVNSASDMYSFGCLMTTVVTGHPPFPGESPIAVARAQVYDRPTPLRELRADCPLALDALVTALLAKNPGDRPDARTTEQALQAIAADPQAAPMVQLVPAPDADQPTRALPATDATGAQPPEGATAALPAGQAPGSLVPTPLSAEHESASSGRPPGGQPPRAAGKQASQSAARVRRIALAVGILLVLALAVWMAWAQGRREVPLAPSTTVTATETQSSTTTATSTVENTTSSTGEQTTAASDQPVSTSSGYLPPATTAAPDTGGASTTNPDDTPTPPPAAPTTAQAAEPTPSGPPARQQVPTPATPTHSPGTVSDNSGSSPTKDAEQGPA